MPDLSPGQLPLGSGGATPANSAGAAVGTVTVPIGPSPCRSGFGPHLGLTYDSGSGNDPFGFGWKLTLPSIVRKTDKGLPLYQDAIESGLFLWGAEDLVPVLNKGGTPWEANDVDPDYVVRRYRPRADGAFARIERWTRKTDSDTHCRSISRDNVLYVYGKDASSRIADPTRIFRWLVCEARDDKGNAVLYEYKPEDGAGVDLTRARGGESS